MWSMEPLGYELENLFCSIEPKKESPSREFHSKEEQSVTTHRSD
jgi:hypothetical protein